MMLGKSKRRSAGFTLIELAVVIAIIALLLGSLLVPLATQIEERNNAEARRILQDSRDALIGFAIANGRLPCPASPTSDGVESPSIGGPCTNPFDGFLPAGTLGIAPTDENGFAVDPWGGRIRYSVTIAHSNAFTTANGMSAQFLVGSLNPNLRVCSTGVGISGGNCAAGAEITSVAAAVLLSNGSNRLTGGTSSDEAPNQNNDAVFVSRLAGDIGAGGAFDDIVIWLSPHILYNKMVAAGKLP